MNAARATATMPIVIGDQNPSSAFGFWVGLYVGKFHGISVGEGEAVGDGFEVGDGIGVGVDGGKVGTLGYPCAFTTGAIAITEANMLRTNSARLTLTKISFKSTGDFFNIHLSRYTNVSFTDLTLCQEEYVTIPKVRYPNFLIPHANRLEIS